MVTVLLANRPYPDHLLDAVQAEAAQSCVLAPATGTGGAQLAARAGRPADPTSTFRTLGRAPAPPAATVSTISTSRQVYWARVDGHPIAADSQAFLRRLLDSRPDEGRLALALCANVPGPLRQEPVWRGVHAVPAGHELIGFDDDGAAVCRRVWAHPDAPRSLDHDEAAKTLGEMLDAAVARRVGIGRVSADVSGGMDSTALAYVLDARHEDALYYHARTDDPLNDDSTFARRAARDLRGQLVELESFTVTTSAFGPEALAGIENLDEGPPAWTTNAPHLLGLFEDASARGVRTHLVGLGGDELFAPLPASILSLCSEGHRRTALRTLRRLRRMQRWSAPEMSRALVGARSYRSELRSRTRRRVASPDAPMEAFAWAPGFTLSPFASERCSELVADRVDRMLDAGAAPHFPDRYRHQVMEAIMFQGEVVRQVNHAFARFGVRWDAPFLDDEVVHFVLGLRPSAVVGPGASKPLLAAATRGVAPAWLFERRDKGEYSADLFSELRRRRAESTALLEDSCLADHGLIDPDRVRVAVEAPLVGTDQLFELEQLVAVERWARSIA